MKARAVPDPDKIIRLKTVLAHTGLSRSTLYRKISEGTFPPQVKISARGAGWHELAVRGWIADPVSYRERDAGDDDPARADRTRSKDSSLAPSRSASR